MATKFLYFLSVFLLFAISAQSNEDPTAKIMEDFSGYPSEPPSCFSDPLSTISVDKESLLKQVGTKRKKQKRFFSGIYGMKIDELSTFSDTPAPSVTRIMYTEKDVLARREGYEPDLTAVATGSHVDAIPYSGKYDGVVGVLGAIEAVNTLRRSGFKPKRTLEVIMFTSEEPTRFGISCLGSRLMAGSDSLSEALKETVDNQNISFLDAARSAGYANDQVDLSAVSIKKGTYFAFLELHIEQGPILEEEGVSIGIVTAIAAPASIKVDFEGNGGHAGAVLMPFRNDAGLAAAELALAVEKHVLESGSVDTVGTVGIIQLHPGAINSIPSKARLEIDTRDIDEKRRNTVVEKIHQSAIDIAKMRGVKLADFTIINQDPPAQSEESIIKAMEGASKQLNLSHKLMISRAYHDSLFMASHKPEEYASINDIANGVKVHRAIRAANYSR
ncbi:hypothetical protein ACLOJK_032350 [Asimina triloba]